MTRDDIIKIAREATDHLPDADSIRLQGIVLLALDAGAAAEQDRCCRIIYGMAGSDNVAQRTVDAIRGKK